MKEEKEGFGFPFPPSSFLLHPFPPTVPVVPAVSIVLPAFREPPALPGRPFVRASSAQPIQNHGRAHPKSPPRPGQPARVALPGPRECSDPDAEPQGARAGPEP
jgi:hypothetical protein